MDAIRCRFVRGAAPTSAVLLLLLAILGAAPSLAESGPHDVAVTWAPDGSAIAFMREFGEGNSDIFILEIESGEVRRLTERQGVDSVPMWSPDGELIAFCSDREGQRDIYVMAPDGTSLRNLTSHPADECDGAWSPDGRRLAFTSDRNGNLDVFILEVADTTREPVQLTDSPRYELTVAGGWSPDGSTILLCSPKKPFDPNAKAPYDHFALYKMAAEPGAPIEEVLDLRGEDSYGSWSPDGNAILFAHQAPLGERGDDYYDVYEADADGSNPRPLVSGPNQQYGAMVSYDGRLLAYHSRKSGRGAIWISNRDGSNARQVTNLEPPSGSN